MKILTEPEWRERIRLHRSRVEPFLRPHRERKFRHETHPVYDFLFTYYSFRPSGLERWSPGYGELLQGEGAEEVLKGDWVGRDSRGLFLEASLFPGNRKQSLRHVRDFLEITSVRPPHFGCGGLHEWAMLYRTTEARHGKVPLRMTGEALAQFLESQTVACSHFDAFRFFTEEARPLNRLQPAREKQMEMDQAGCLHVNMDLYKWAYKFSPWIPSELLWDCFLLAARAREIDMRASPYDLSDFGFAPITVETPEGRAEYEKEQREIFTAAVPLRRNLLAVYRSLYEAVEAADSQRAAVLL